LLKDKAFSENSRLMEVGVNEKRENW
jgi:hypothetical protein